ncbi:hypothetical protein [Burkholderia glumae]|uniref:hypothetical protein n=1 Tax=Burkholderia glumae TaxID=337 RepID=UPI0012FE2EF1|nr:hypothetical protein [Burkholderia glumae]QHE09818.1 hypothetical protein GQR88_05070 [Burkholderia glumae AU6208]
MTKQAGYTRLSEAARQRIYQVALAKGVWESRYTTALQICAHACATYIILARRLMGLSFEDAQETFRPELTGLDLENEVEAVRQLARKTLIEFCVIPSRTDHIYSIDADGLDADIVAVCSLQAHRISRTLS